MDDRTIANVLALLTAAWPKEEPPDATVALWADALRDIDSAVGMEAAATLTRTSSWYPKLAEFLEAVNVVRRRNVIQGSQVVALPPAPPAARTLAQARILAMREAMEGIGRGGRKEQTHTQALANCPGCARLNRRVVEIQAELEAKARGGAA